MEKMTLLELADRMKEWGYDDLKIFTIILDILNKLEGAIEEHEKEQAEKCKK